MKTTTYIFENGVTTKTVADKPEPTRESYAEACRIIKQAADGFIARKKADRILTNNFKVVRHARHGNEQAASVYGESLHLSQIVTLHPMNGDAVFIRKAIRQDAAEVAATGRLYDESVPQ